MAGFVRFAVAQVSGSQLSASGGKIGNSCQPQRFQVEQMPGMFLRRPLIGCWLAHQHFTVDAPKHFFKSHRSSPESHNQIGILLYGKRKLEFPSKPERD